MGPPRLAIFARALRATTGFVSLGTCVCEHLHAHFMVDQTRITLIVNGRSACTIDDAEMTDPERLAHGTTRWFVDTRYHIASELPWVPVELDALVMPLFSSRGVAGALELGRRAGFDHALTRELSCAATLISVRMAELGIAPSDEEALRELTSRQAEVAQLAALGSTNQEIGEHLGVSINTVKKHLKDIFDRLGTTNRTELAGALARRPPRDTAPPIGVTRAGRVRITRAPDR
ncbi:MAG: helix-turn-helix transcriptional regulator [Kofleriaceae bacterium]|nr:helix-turn-helix transcriptional regulator [Kofleriaceae bacterium]